MKAGIVFAPGDIRCGEWDTPKLQREEVLVRVRMCGICGSDIPRVLQGTAHSYPIVLGHEFAGDIVEIGEGVAGRAIGDRVSCAPLKPCMACPSCQHGDYAMCRSYSFIGSREQGAFAEYVAVPARNTIRLPDNVDYRTGALFEPATVALHGLWRNAYQPGETVLVLGAGTIGLLVAMIARSLGSKHVTLCDIDRDRLSIAQSLGFEHLYNTSDPGFARAVIESSPDKLGRSFVVETAGAPAAMQLAFQVAAPHARVCYIGTSPKALVFDPKVFELLNRKEFNLTGSWMSYSSPFPGREWVQVSQMFHAGQLPCDALIHDVFPLERIADAFALYREPGKVKGRVLIDMG